MADITFSSPAMNKDVTVYAVAGSTDKTVLKLAKANKVPIPFECEDGLCGSCVVRVTPLENKSRMSQALTEKEHDTLTAKGLLTIQEAENAVVRDMPPTYRLACQLIPRDEDVLIEFTGEPGVHIK
jgi:ferredoxin